MATTTLDRRLTPARHDLADARLRDLVDAARYVAGEERRVVSAICPHEGCEVEWSADQKQFLCPCHDSAFSPEGARMSGPAQSALAPLRARVKGDTLEMQPGDAATPSAPAEATANG